MPILLLLAFFLSVAHVSAEIIEEKALHMGTLVRLATEFDPTSPTVTPAHVRTTLTGGMNRIAELEALLSEYRPGNDLAKLAQAAGKHPVKVHPMVFDVLKEALRLGDLTAGAFDITFKPLGRLWNVEHLLTPPPAGAIAITKRLVDYRLVQLDDLAGTVFLPLAGMEIALGGLAKGYIIDAAADYLRNHGLTRFLVDGGGDLRLVGSKTTGPWRVGIRHPRRPDQFLRVVAVKDLAVVTSGDYERFTMLEGKRYHHIIDPVSGKPGLGCQSVTVIHRDTMTADGLATGVFILGAEKGLALLERLPETEGLLIDHVGAEHATSGFSRFVVTP